jgi:hypothetical protein
MLLILRDFFEILELLVEIIFVFILFREGTPHSLVLNRPGQPNLRFFIGLLNSLGGLRIEFLFVVVEVEHFRQRFVFPLENVLLDFLCKNVL